MESKAHLLVARRLKTLCPEYNVWFSVGSIIPDLFLHTYLKGHTYEAAAELTYKRLIRLRMHGRNTRWSYFMMGYIIHYIEDFFTYPHNSTFKDNLKEHMSYEKKQYRYVRDNKYTFVRQNANIYDMESWIRQLHDEYLDSECGIENDMAYICKAVEGVVSQLVYEFCINESMLEIQRKERILERYYNW